jgi:hypothetical protein
LVDRERSVGSAKEIKVLGAEPDAEDGRLVLSDEELGIRIVRAHHAVAICDIKLNVSPSFTLRQGTIDGLHKECVVEPDAFTYLQRSVNSRKAEGPGKS